MSCGRRRRKQEKPQDRVEVGDEPSSNPQKSVIAEKDPKQVPVVPNTPTTSASTVSALTEAPKKKAKKISWLHRVVSRKKTTQQTPVKEVVAEATNLPSSATKKSVIAEKDPKQVAVVPNTPTTSASTVSALTEAPKKKAKKISWLHRVVGRKRTTQQTPVKEVVAENTNLPSSATEKSVDTIKEFQGEEAGVQEASPTPDSKALAATEPQPQNEDVSNSVDRRYPSVTTNSNLESTKTDLNVKSVKTDSNLKAQKAVFIEDILPSDALKYRPFTPIGHGGSQQAESNTSMSASIFESPSASRKPLSREELVCLGLPNLAQTCYMNSTLQGLLTLTHFMQEVHNQQRVWSFHPQSQLMSLFEKVELCHFSSDKMKKKIVLSAFKGNIAESNYEFNDNRQKDAFEFLSCVLNEMKSLSVDLYQAAFNMGMSYTCPVDAHIAFQMLSTRTCMRCGMQSRRVEDCLNLSLDITCRGSVSQCLQNYLEKSQLEYRCESCRTQESSQQWSFASLPNVLIIQLQRFRLSKSNKLKKLSVQVDLSRELVLDSDSNITEQTRYSLVSIISHFGSSASHGHYICDGAFRQQESGDMTDGWLTYNDKIVKERTAESVCQLRQKTAYVLFYEKQR